MSNAQWLAQVHEEALEPALPICDPHHHLWDFRHGAPAERYFVDDYIADIAGGHNVVSSVFIECGTMFSASGPHERRMIGETEFANGQAAMSASGDYGSTRVAAGIVGTAYLDQGDAVAAVLDAQLAAGNGRFRGIRQGVTHDADPEVRNHRTQPQPGLLASPGFRAGFAHLAPRELTFEAWCYHPQIAEVTALARAFPETTIILNHFGGPIGVGSYGGRREEVFAVWRKAIAALAACPNVYAKLGGLGMDVNGFGWHQRETPPTSEQYLPPVRPYFEHTIEVFGVERCMFESNFPVDRLSSSFTVLWNAFKRLTVDFSRDERARLFHDTAATVYRIAEL